MIRRLAPSDAAEFLAAVAESRESLLEFLPWPAEPSTMAGATEALERLESNRNEVAFGLFAPATGVLRGCGALEIVTPNPDVHELSYWTRLSHRRQHVAMSLARFATAYAFERRGAVRVQITHDTNNAASAGLARRMGFLEEGIVRGLTRTPTGVIGSRCTGDARLWGMVRSDLDGLGWYPEARAAVRAAGGEASRSP